MNTLKVGDLVPNFSCADEKGILHNLEDYKGKKLLFSFIPKQVLRAVQQKLVIYAIIIKSSKTRVIVCWESVQIAKRSN